MPGKFVPVRKVIYEDESQILILTKAIEKGRCISYQKYPCREAEWSGIEERSKFSLPEDKDRLIKAVAYVFGAGERLDDFIPPHHYHSDLAVSKSAVRHTLGVLQGARGGYSRLDNAGYKCVYLHMIAHARDCEIKFSNPKPEWGISQETVDKFKWWED